jgi:hypothetical protein
MTLNYKIKYFKNNTGNFYLIEFELKFDVNFKRKIYLALPKLDQIRFKFKIRRLKMKPFQMH